MNVTAFLREFREYGVSRDHADALAFDRWRDAQALDDAEFAHGPAICTDADCTELGCLAYHRSVMNTTIVAGYPHGFTV